jgi:hypothetical protein
MESNQLKDPEITVTISPRVRPKVNNLIVRELTKINVNLIQLDETTSSASGVIQRSQPDRIMVFSPIKHLLQEQLLISFKLLDQVVKINAEVIASKDYYRSSTGLIRDFNGLCPNQIIEVRLLFSNEQDRENYYTHF